MSDYADALARALAYTDDAGLSDGTDRPASTVAEAMPRPHLLDLVGDAKFADGRPYWTSLRSAVETARNAGYDVTESPYAWQAPATFVGPAVYEARQSVAGRFEWVLS